MSEGIEVTGLSIEGDDAPSVPEIAVVDEGKDFVELEVTPGFDFEDAAGNAVDEDEPVDTGVAEELQDVADVDDDELYKQLVTGNVTPEVRKRLLARWFPLPEDFPDKEQQLEWHNRYKRIRVHRMAPGEAYVVRAMSRPEYRKFTADIAERAETEKMTALDARYVGEEMLVERCLLWPPLTPEQINGTSDPLHDIALAGTVTVLAYDIQEMSNLTESSVGPFEEL